MLAITVPSLVVSTCEILCAWERYSSANLAYGYLVPYSFSSSSRAGPRLSQTCAQPFLMSTCISLIKQATPYSSLDLFLARQDRNLRETMELSNRGVVNHLRRRFSHMPHKIARADMYVPIALTCTALYAAELYLTLTNGLSQTPSPGESGLSRCIRQHSEPSTWYSASESGTPRNCSGFVVL